MTLITCMDWTDNQDYSKAWAPTNDPRVVAVIVRDEEASFSMNLDGDAINPTFIVERERADHVGGYEGDSESVAQRIVEAQDRFRYAAGYRYNGLTYAMMAKGDEMLARWAWIFHGTTFHRGSYGYGNEYDMLILSTPEFREHVGLVGEYEHTREQAQADCDAMQSEVSAIADGYVYGIGYAVFSERVTDEEPIDIEDGNWDENIECWGFVGEDYAKQSAGAFEVGAPELPELLTFA